MADRLDDVLTPVPREDLFRSLWRAWINVVDLPPSRASVHLLLAHWAIETGWGKHMHCFNLGNVKSREGDGRDFCYFECGEELFVRQAEKWQRDTPSLVTILRRYTIGSVTMASVLIRPDHPACRFRAFRSLDEGAVDYLALLRQRFSLAWPFVCAGDPDGFVRALKQQRYFTASADTYATAVRSIFSDLQKNLDVSALPVVSDAQATRLMGLVATTSQELIDALAKQAHERKDDE